MRRAGLWIAVAAVLAAAAVLWLKSRAPAERPAPAPAAPPSAERAAPAAPGGEGAAAPETAVAPARVTEEAPPPPKPIPLAEPKEMVFTGEVLRLRSDAVLASVNGAAITLKDLMPVSPYVLTERSLRSEMFDALMERAVQREVVIQAARDRGVDLSDEQQASLAKIRARALERDPASFTDAHDDYQAKADFEVRDFSGLMLQESLLEASGGPPKYVTPEAVQEYYEAHKGEFPELPEDPEEREKAWQSIEVDIRSTLAPQVDATYLGSLHELVSGLVSRAAVTQYVTTSPSQ